MAHYIAGMWRDQAPSSNEDETMSKDSKTTLRGRDAKTGEFIPVEEARQRPSTTTVERVPKPGYGDTKKDK